MLEFKPTGADMNRLKTQQGLRLSRCDNGDHLVVGFPHPAVRGFGISEKALLHNRVIAIAGEASPHDFSIFPIAEWSNLHVEEGIAGGVGNEDRILLLAQRGNQDLSIFLF